MDKLHKNKISFIANSTGIYIEPQLGSLSTPASGCVYLAILLVRTWGNPSLYWRLPIDVRFLHIISVHLRPRSCTGYQLSLSSVYSACMAKRCLHDKPISVVLGKIIRLLYNMDATCTEYQKHIYLLRIPLWLLFVQEGSQESHPLHSLSKLRHRIRR